MIYHFDSKQALLDSTVFSRSNQTTSDGDAAGPIEYIVNKYLFAANYTLLDAPKGQGDVVFDVNGHTNGLNDYINYRVGTDFIGPETPDYVTFRNKDDKYSTYVFDIAADTLKLYEAMEDSTEVTKKGSLKYTLKRK